MMKFQSTCLHHHFLALVGTPPLTLMLERHFHSSAFQLLGVATGKACLPMVGSICTLYATVTPVYTVSTVDVAVF